jgi:hypothetical protein
MASLGALAFKKLIENASPEQVEKYVPSPIRDQFLKKIKSATKKYKSRKEANIRKCHPDNINKLVTKKDLIDCILLSIPSLYEFNAAATRWDSTHKAASEDCFPACSPTRESRKKPSGLVVSKLRGHTKEGFYNMKMNIVIHQINRWVIPLKMRISLGQFKRIIDILFTKFFRELFRADYNFFIDKITQDGERIQTKKHKISPGKTIRSKSHSSNRTVESISSEKMFRFIAWILQNLPQFLKDNINVRSFRTGLSEADKVEFDSWVNNWVSLDMQNRTAEESQDEWSREYDRVYGKNGLISKKYKISYDQVIKFFEVFNHSQLQEIIVNTRSRSEMREMMRNAIYIEP